MEESSYLDTRLMFMEKAMAPHSSTPAWKIPWTEEPGQLQSMGSRRVGHDWATSLWLFTFMNWRRKWQPTPVFLPGESQGQGSLAGCHLWGHTVRHDWSDLAAANVHEVWVGSQHKSALSFPFPIHILNPGTSQLASSYLRALKKNNKKPNKN